MTRIIKYFIYYTVLFVVYMPPYYGTPEKRAHDVIERMEIVANLSEKHRMTSWTGRQFL